MDITLKELSKLTNMATDTIRVYLANKTIFAGKVINLSELDIIKMQIKFYSRNKGAKDKTNVIRKSLEDKIKRIKGE